LDLAQQPRIHVHGYEGAFLEVDEEPCCRSKLLEQQPKTTSRGGIRAENDERVIALYEPLQNIGDQEEEVRRQWVPLPEAAHDLDPFAWDAVDHAVDSARTGTETVSECKKQ
jgi:hypothetical protein